MAFAACDALYAVAIIGSSSPLGIIFRFIAAPSIMMVVWRVLLLLMMAGVDDQTFVVAAVTVMVMPGSRGHLHYQGR